MPELLQWLLKHPWIIFFFQFSISFSRYRFSINFVDNRDCDNFLFHFNPRPKEGCVVRNAKFGSWGPEERDQEDFPFWPGQYFDSIFVATDIGYAVGYINLRKLLTFIYSQALEV